MLYSIGYEGRDIGGFVETLCLHGVDELIDVRLTPSSRKPGFSKSRLSAALTQAGIEYRHLRELGNPRENRDGFRAGRPEAMALYRAKLENGSRDAVAEVVDAARERTVALLCFERDVTTCHRHLITHVVQEHDPRLPVLHLE